MTMNDTVCVCYKIILSTQILQRVIIFSFPVILLNIYFKFMQYKPTYCRYSSITRSFERIALTIMRPTTNNKYFSHTFVQYVRGVCMCIGFYFVI